jgi:hypothetical protein
MRLLEQPASGSRATACRNVEQSWRLLEDIERYLIALDLDFAGKWPFANFELH